MGKYTEAIARKIDEENYYHDCMISYFDIEPVSKHYKDMMKKASLELEALQIADRVSQIDYMEMPTPKITETDNGVKANANILEAVEVITHNNLLAKIKGEEERIYAK